MKLKKLLSTFIACIISLQCLPLISVNSAEDNFTDSGTLTVGSATAERGDTVTLSVSLENNPGINAMAIEPVYDTAALHLESMTAGEGVWTNCLIAKKYVWTNLGGDIKDNGIVLSLTFTVLDSVSLGNTAVSLICDTTNYAEETLKFDIVAGTITVTSDDIAYFSLSGGSFVTGNTAEISITLEENPGICSAVITPIYDNSVLELTEIKVGEGLFANAAAYDKYAWINFGDMTENGTICTLVFKILDSAPHGDTSVSIKAEMSNWSEKTVDGVTTPGIVTIHNASDIITTSTIPATCTESGFTKGSYCSICGEIIIAREEIPAFGHVVITDEAVPATCTKDGCTDGSHCSRCGKIFKAKEILPATGHNFAADYTIDTEATTESPGQMSRHCLSCDQITDVTEIPILARIKGDINGDGEINSKDLTRLMRYVAGFNVIAHDPDLNGDGSIDTKDLSRLMRFLAGFDTEFA